MLNPWYVDTRWHDVSDRNGPISQTVLPNGGSLDGFDDAFDERVRPLSIGNTISGNPCSAITRFALAPYKSVTHR